MANYNGKRKLLAKIMAWAMSILMVGSCCGLLITLIIDMASR